MLDKILIQAEKKGLNQGEIESMVGLSHGRISKWKHGTGKIAAIHLWKIAKILDVTVEYLLDDEIEEPETVASGSSLRKVLEIARALGPEESLNRLLLKADPVDRDRAAYDLGNEATGGAPVGRVEIKVNPDPRARKRKTSG